MKKQLVALFLLLTVNSAFAEVVSWQMLEEISPEVLEAAFLVASESSAGIFTIVAHNSQMENLGIATLTEISRSPFPSSLMTEDERMSLPLEVVESLDGRFYVLGEIEGTSKTRFVWGSMTPVPNTQDHIFTALGFSTDYSATEEGMANLLYAVSGPTVIDAKISQESEKRVTQQECRDVCIDNYNDDAEGCRTTKTVCDGLVTAAYTLCLSACGVTGPGVIGCFYTCSAGAALGGAGCVLSYSGCLSTAGTGLMRCNGICSHIPPDCTQIYEAQAEVFVNTINNENVDIKVTLIEHSTAATPPQDLYFHRAGLKRFPFPVKECSTYTATVTGQFLGPSARTLECNMVNPGGNVDGPLRVFATCSVPGEDPCEQGLVRTCPDVNNLNCIERRTELPITTTEGEFGPGGGWILGPPGSDIAILDRFDDCTRDLPPIGANLAAEPKSFENSFEVYLRNRPEATYRMDQMMMVEGIARHAGTSLSPDIYVDGEPVTLIAFQAGLHDPHTCQEAPATDCNANSRFRGALDLSNLPSGTHRLTAAYMLSDSSALRVHEVDFEVSSAAVSRSAELISMDLPTAMSCDEERRSTVTLRNTGTETWSVADGFYLAASGDHDPFRGTARIGIEPTNTTVPPGSTHAFNFYQKAPSAAGTYQTEWQMLKTGVGRFGDIAASDVEVTCPVALFDDAALHESNLPASMQCGESQIVRLSMLNNGTTDWSEAEQVRLGAVGGADPFTSTSRHLLEDGVLTVSGHPYPFDVLLTAPSQPGTYRTDWRMVRDTTGEWFGESVVRDIQVYCPASTEEVAVVPAADGSVFQANPTLTLPSDPTLYVKIDVGGDGKRTLLRFVLPNIPGEILAAKLRVRTRSFVPELAVYEVTNHSWSEATLNWNNHLPANLDDFHYLRSGIDLWSEAWHDIDVSDAVTCCGTVDFGLASGSSADQRLYGRTSMHQPQLVITYQPD